MQKLIFLLKSVQKLRQNKTFCLAQTEELHCKRVVGVMKYFHVYPAGNLSRLQEIPHDG